MKILGIIGFPLTHSFSKQYFTEKFQRESIDGYRFDAFELKSISSSTSNDLAVFSNSLCSEFGSSKPCSIFGSGPNMP